MHKRVYAVLVDQTRERVGLNLKDATLQKKVRRYEGKISLFGGAIHTGESLLDALSRELEEELPQFLTPEEMASARLVFDTKTIAVYRIDTHFEGDKFDLRNNRIGLSAAICTEGDAIVRSFDYVRRTPRNAFLNGDVKKAILAAIT